MTRKNTLFFFVTAVLLMMTTVLFGGEPAVIVTVDGLSFANTLLPPGSEPIDAFPWSRDANDTLETVETLREFLKEKYREAQQANKGFIVVAHSWGTVLTYLALSSQSMQ
ncbi:MAG: hypothetical protein GY950_13280, partial [bacterium]|nr:hypothetical protein [bacterium]